VFKRDKPNNYIKKLRFAHVNGLNGAVFSPPFYLRLNQRTLTYKEEAQTALLKTQSIPHSKHFFHLGYNTQTV
jgi:hypothetical protein